MSTEDDEALEMFWDDLRIARARVPPPPDAAARLRALSDPGDLIIGTSKDRILAVVKADGTIAFGPEYKPDEAATVFWEAIGRHRFPYEDQILVIQHMEAVLTRLGLADTRLHELHLALQAGDPTARDLIAGAQVALERTMSQAIELGRGLARRPGIPIPAVPERIPERVRSNPNSEYVGAPGLDPEPLAADQEIAENDPHEGQ